MVYKYKPYDLSQPPPTKEQLVKLEHKKLEAKIKKLEKEMKQLK